MLSNTELDLAEKIKQLQLDRDRHAEAIADIDRVLRRVSDALKTMQQGSNSESIPPSTSSREPRRRGKFSQTAEQSVLTFIQSKGNPSTAEINAHWRSEGRKGTANVTLLKLLKETVIRRVADSGVRGSRYIASSS
jgi:hypothetical protein